MLSLPASVRIFVATELVDGRKGVDSLVGIVGSVFLEDPFTGHMYVFFSRRRDRVRIIYWDRNGFAMWTKRVEKGRFHRHGTVRNAQPISAIEPADLAAILDGIELVSANRRPRWEPRRQS
jgi:transposase